MSIPVAPKGKIFCVDFDGTTVDHAYPLVGEDVPGAAVVLKHLSQDNRLILWTMRSNGCLRNPNVLRDAIRWYKDRDIPLYGVNQNPDQASWTNSPKAYSHLIIDDTGVGCPLTHLPGMDRPVVNWDAIRHLLGIQHDTPNLWTEYVHRNSQWLKKSFLDMSAGETELAPVPYTPDVKPLEVVGADGQTRRVSFTIGTEAISYTKCVLGSGDINPGYIKTLGDVEAILYFLKGVNCNG